MSDSSDDSEEYIEGKKNKRTKVRQQPQKKRRKLSTTAIPISNEEPIEIALSRSFFDELGNGDPEVLSFQDIMDRLLPEFLQTRVKLQQDATEVDKNGKSLRPPTRYEISSLIRQFPTSSDSTPVMAITMRKLKLDQERRRAAVPSPKLTATDSITPLPVLRSSVPPNPEVIDALYSIRTTPFASSFLSRLHGTKAKLESPVIAMDWETTTPWMSLMSDIRNHYAFSHPEREQPIETVAPIVYTSLKEAHVTEVNELLERSFWKGINIRDSLDYWPERCTVVALYKRLVVGAAILSSPRETYITYLAVRAGWDNARIARSMLFHLIMLNPTKDITLHVSVNNSAMLLYNQFGFKAEGFVSGFYENFLDSNSRASKNAFRLRLRR